MERLTRRVRLVLPRLWSDESGSMNAVGNGLLMLVVLILGVVAARWLGETVADKINDVASIISDTATTPSPEPVDHP